MVTLTPPLSRTNFDKSLVHEDLALHIKQSHSLGFGTFDFESYESSYIPYIQAVTYNVSNCAGMKIGNLQSP